MKKQTIRLITIMGIGALAGPVAIAAVAGLFKVSNAFALAIGFMSGPGAIINASLLNGEIKERIFSAIIAGIIATSLVALSAGFGPKFLEFFNINILKIFGGFSVLLIALLIMGIKIPENSPLWIMIIGLIAGVIWR
jgi:hypothetical protein